jgi:hypothetical protein
VPYTHAALRLLLSPCGAQEGGRQCLHPLVLVIQLFQPWMVIQTLGALTPSQPNWDQGLSGRGCNREGYNFHPVLCPLCDSSGLALAPRVSSGLISL